MIFSIIQAYAPISKAKDNEFTIFYDQLREALEQSNKTIILMGDFNACIGQQQRNEERILGPYCYGKRNKSGAKLIQFAFQNNFTIINSIFKKKSVNMWTWLSPKKAKSQLDYILSNTKEQFTNIEIINQLNYPSDHRLVRATFQVIKTKKSRAKYNHKDTVLKTKDEERLFLKKLKQNIESSNLWDKGENIESYNSKLNKIIIDGLNSTKELNNQNRYIISEETKTLLHRRNELMHKKPLCNEEKQELSNLFKNVHKRIRKEYEEYRLKIIEKHLMSTGSLKKGFKKLNSFKTWIPNLKEKPSGKEIYSRPRIIEIATNFYKNLYAEQENSPINTSDVNAENLSSLHSQQLQRFSIAEVIKKIETLKKGKSFGPDNIPNELFIVGKYLLAPILTTLFNKILESRKIPKKWAESDITLLYKKRDPANISNYRPISLQPSLYKLFASCLEKRISTITEKYQPIEQAGFRKCFSTIDHIYTVEQVIEKYEEQRCPLYLAFIDYAKAFDSLSHNSMWKALTECKIPLETIELLQDIYKKSISRVKLDKKGPEINICRGVRQGDPLSPTIFITVLQSIMKKLNWSKKGINIQGKYLSNLRFADDIVLFSETASQLEEMINELHSVSHAVGLELNTDKTKILSNNLERPIEVNNQTLEYVQKYIYLGKEVSFKKSRQRDELNRRVNMTWGKFWSYKEVLKSNFPLKLKKKILDSCLLPCLSYACQTWIYNTYTKRKIEICQRAMERSLLNLKRRDKKRNTEIRKRTNVIDALSHCKKLKWKWAGHIARMEDKRWTKEVTTWDGPTGKRKRGRPIERWVDEIKKLAGDDWMSVAKDREKWKKLEEAYTRREVLNNN